MRNFGTMSEMGVGVIKSFFNRQKNRSPAAAAFVVSCCKPESVFVAGPRWRGQQEPDRLTGHRSAPFNFLVNAVATISNNSVLELRAKQMAESRREFKARGAKLTRCERCLLAEHYCICEGVEQAECNAAVCLLMYHNAIATP